MSKERSKISSSQLALLTAGSALMFPYTIMPILRTPPANQDVWVVLLLALVYIVILNLPLLLLANKFRGLDLYEINELILGKVGGKITAGIYMLFAVFCFTACMLIGMMFIKTYLLARTPEWAILLFMVVPITYLVLKDAGTIARVASFVVPAIIFTIILFFALGLRDMDINALRPIIADSTFWDLNRGAFYTAARFSEVLIIIVFSFHLMNRSSVNGTYFKGLLIFGISFFIILVGILLLVGSDVAKLTINPYYFYSRQVGGEDFFQRVQSLNVLVWFTGTLIKLAAYGYIATHLFARITNRKTHRFYAIPLSILALILSLLPFMRRMTTLHILKSYNVFPWIVFGVIFVVSSFLCIVYLFRYASVNKKAREKIKKREEDEKKDEEEDEGNADEGNGDKKSKTIVL